MGRYAQQQTAPGKVFSAKHGTPVAPGAGATAPPISFPWRFLGNQQIRKLVQSAADKQASAAAKEAIAKHNAGEWDRIIAIDHMARVDTTEERVRAAIGDEPILKPAPQVGRFQTGTFVLSGGAAKFLSALLRKGFRTDLDVMDFEFRFVRSGGITNASTKKEIARNHWIVEITESNWRQLSPTANRAHQLALILHELTHGVQDKALPWYHTRVGLKLRSRAEGKQGIWNETVPETLKDMPFRDLDPLDGRFTLEQMALRAEYELLVNELHLEPKAWDG